MTTCVTPIIPVHSSWPRRCCCQRRVARQIVDTTCLPRIEISISARQLWVITSDSDTVYTAPVAVGSGRTLRTPERTWTFDTPLGATTVAAKEIAPLWVPPDWYYLELARVRRLEVERLAYGDTIPISRGRRLVIHRNMVGVIGTDSMFTALRPGADVIFDGTLYIPPFGTDQRRVAGMLGPYRLLLANGVGLHGTPYTDSIGKAATHGCIRLYDDDIAWLFANIPIGSQVVVKQ
jgi:hypothetical protein